MLDEASEHQPCSSFVRPYQACQAAEHVVHDARCWCIAARKMGMVGCTGVSVGRREIGRAASKTLFFNDLYRRDARVSKLAR
ncbi:hypothetical protein XHV734_2536 [Xanthomonas hortorum pv. vitians]|nr:hypothetical protein XHV734_2536 [Xanthomonas hortorum pv. vitians]